MIKVLLYFHLLSAVFPPNLLVIFAIMLYFPSVRWIDSFSSAKVKAYPCLAHLKLNIQFRAVSVVLKSTLLVEGWSPEPSNGYQIGSY